MAIGRADRYCDWSLWKRNLWEFYVRIENIRFFLGITEKSASISYQQLVISSLWRTSCDNALSLFSYRVPRKYCQASKHSVFVLVSLDDVEVKNVYFLEALSEANSGDDSRWELSAFVWTISDDKRLIDFAAYLVMVCGGMFLSYGVFNNFVGYQMWTAGMSTFTLFFVAGCFHIALIIGAIATSLTYNTVEIFNIHVSFIMLHNYVEFHTEGIHNVLVHQHSADVYRVSHYYYSSEFLCRRRHSTNPFRPWLRLRLSCLHHLRIGNFITQSPCSTDLRTSPKPHHRHVPV